LSQNFLLLVLLLLLLVVVVVVVVVVFYFAELIISVQTICVNFFGHNPSFALSPCR